MKTNKNGNYSESSMLSMYLKEIEKIPLLNREEEITLAVRAKDGDQFARNRLIESNLRFVVSIAKQYQNRGLPLEDLVNEGNIGLLTAIEKFKPEMGYHFISYAVWWIRQSIMKAIGDKSRLIRLPLNKSTELNTVNQAKNKLEQLYGIEPSVEEIAEEVSMDTITVKELLSYSNDVSSLDSPITGDTANTIKDFIPSDRPGVEDIEMEKSMKDYIESELNRLPEKERKIIELRFGLNGNMEMSLKEVGELFNLTKERIRQIEKKVLIKLSNDEEFQQLKAYIA